MQDHILLITRQALAELSLSGWTVLWVEEIQLTDAQCSVAGSDSIMAGYNLCLSHQSHGCVQLILKQTPGDSLESLKEQALRSLKDRVENLPFVFCARSSTRRVH